MALIKGFKCESGRMGYIVIDNCFWNQFLSIIYHDGALGDAKIINIRPINDDFVQIYLEWDGFDIVDEGWAIPWYIILFRPKGDGKIVVSSVEKQGDHFPGA